MATVAGETDVWQGLEDLVGSTVPRGAFAVSDDGLPPSRVRS
jgi:hypothetical protein